MPKTGITQVLRNFLGQFRAQTDSQSLQDFTVCTAKIFLDFSSNIGSGGANQLKRQVFLTFPNKQAVGGFQDSLQIIPPAVSGKIEIGGISFKRNRFENSFTEYHIIF